MYKKIIKIEFMKWLNLLLMDQIKNKHFMEQLIQYKLKNYQNCQKQLPKKIYDKNLEEMMDHQMNIFFKHFIKVEIEMLSFLLEIS